MAVAKSSSSVTGKLISGIGIEDVGQRLAVVAVGRNPAAPDHVIDFQPEKRDVTGSAAIGAGREQSDEPPFALERALRVEHFDADVIHVHAAVNERPFVRFGYDERLGLGKKCAHIRRKCRAVVAAADHPRADVGKYAEARGIDRIELRVALADERVIAEPQKREVIVAKPLEQRDAFLELFGRQVRRIGLEIGNRVGELVEHFPPVAHGELYLRENAARAFDETRPLPVVHCRIELRAQ